MSSRRLRWSALAAAAWLLVLLVGAIPARAADPVRAADGDIPPPQPASGQAVALYDRIPLWNYTIDGDNSYQDAPGKQTYVTVNALLTAKAWLVHTAIRTAEYAAGLHLMEPLAGPAAAVSQRLSAEFWTQPWVTGGLALSGLAALLAGAVYRRRSRAYSLLVGTVLVLVASTWLAGRLDAVLNSAVWSAAGATDVGLRAVADGAAALQPSGGQAATTGRPGWLIRAGGEALWETHVLQPWANLEFASMETARMYTAADMPGGTFLNLAPSARQALFFQLPVSQRQRDFTWWGADFTVRRLVLAAVGLLLAVLAAGPLLLLAGGLVLYQVFFVLLLMLAPVWLLLALWWPGAAGRLLRQLLWRGLGALVMQVVYGLLLAIVLLLLMVTADLAPHWGWVVTAILQATVSLAVYFYRQEWLYLFSGRLRSIMARDRGRTVTRTGHTQFAGPRSVAVPTERPVHLWAMVSTTESSAGHQPVERLRSPFPATETPTGSFLPANGFREDETPADSSQNHDPLTDFRDRMNLLRTDMQARRPEWPAVHGGAADPAPADTSLAEALRAPRSPGAQRPIQPGGRVPPRSQ